jgi:hypothetical protein
MSVYEDFINGHNPIWNYNHDSFNGCNVDKLLKNNGWFATNNYPKENFYIDVLCVSSREIEKGLYVFDFHDFSKFKDRKLVYWRYTKDNMHNESQNINGVRSREQISIRDYLILYDKIRWVKPDDYIPIEPMIIETSNRETKDRKVMFWDGNYLFDGNKFRCIYSYFWRYMNYADEDALRFCNFIKKDMIERMEFYKRKIFTHEQFEKSLLMQNIFRDVDTYYLSEEYAPEDASFIDVVKIGGEKEITCYVPDIYTFYKIIKELVSIKWRYTVFENKKQEKVMEPGKGWTKIEYGKEDTYPPIGKYVIIFDSNGYVGYFLISDANQMNFSKLYNGNYWKLIDPPSLAK